MKRKNAYNSAGNKQQENENEASAIAALRRALKINPNLLPAYLSLATSYANESLTAGVHTVLEEWLRRNPEYSHLLDRFQNTHQEEYATRLFLQAAKARPGADLDADVQVGLGVLLNVSHDYEKAVDCFQVPSSPSFL